MAFALRVFLTSAEIQKRIGEMGAAIAKDYPGGPLYLIGILRGSFMFLADLARATPIPTRIDFIGISSYGKDKSSSGQVKVTKDLDVSIEGCDVVVVEDIIDSGITLSYLLSLLEQRRPRSIRIAALLDKPDRRQRQVHVDYVGFEIPDKFVVGYGLDYAEDYRALSDICTFEDALLIR